MPAPTNRAVAEKSAVGSLTFDAILEAALQAFHENGYHGSTVRDIARRVGVTVPALYYHHENKEAMLFALLDGSITRLLDLSHAAEATAGTPIARFDAVIGALVRHVALNARLTFLDNEIRSLSPQRHRDYVDKRDAIERLARDAVADGAADGTFDCEFPIDTTRAIVGMVQAIATWYRPDGSLSVDDLVGRYLGLAHRMIGV